MSAEQGERERQSTEAQSALNESRSQAIRRMQDAGRVNREDFRLYDDEEHDL